ncbi:MAG: redoxin domain-containing protein [Candidatus Thorarchaeota archaeon]|nr:redoxin domain-containing protein [Candidatus Thorarchaeota archaeon]
MSTGNETQEHGPPQEGQTAPDFVLPSTTSQEVHLLEYRGQCVVLVFFPQTFTNFSTMQIRQIIQFHVALQTLGAVVLGISVEPLEALRTFADQEEIPFPLLSDFEREVAKAYGVFEEELDGFRHVAKPSVFVLNKKQRILYRWVSDDLTKLPDFDQILGVIQGLKPNEDIC